jgi:cobalt-zinc-cadmium resistance protein CzcA
MLMTALSACIGLLPAAVSTGIGSQVQRPLATVVVGGMFLGPIILLVVVPAVQTLFLDGRRSAPEAVQGEQPSALRP